jgi:hypothetical protein
MTLDVYSSKRVLGDEEAMGGYIRLTYTLFRQEVPISKHIFIHRAFLPWCGDEFKRRIGHVSKDSIKQTLHLISNHLRGYVDYMLKQARYIGLELDDGTDCAHLSHLLVFAKFFWPGPTNAEPSDLPVLTSYEEVAAEKESVRDCEACAKKRVTKHVVCSNGHVMCATCVTSKVSNICYVILIIIVFFFAHLFQAQAALHVQRRSVPFLCSRETTELPCYFQAADVRKVLADDATWEQLLAKERQQEDCVFQLEPPPAADAVDSSSLTSSSSSPSSSSSSFTSSMVR